MLPSEWPALASTRKPNKKSSRPSANLLTPNRNFTINSNTKQQIHIILCFKYFRTFESVKFWGKINGAAADYLIIVAQNPIAEESDYPESVYWYCTNHTFKLKELPNSSIPPGLARETPFTVSVALLNLMFLLL